MNPLLEAKAWIQDEYNEYISVFEYSDHIRVTNGSAAHYVNVGLKDGQFIVHGERYGETFRKTCEKDKQSLLDTLSSTI